MLRLSPTPSTLSSILLPISVTLTCSVPQPYTEVLDTYKKLRHNYILPSLNVGALIPDDPIPDLDRIRIVI